MQNTNALLLFWRRADACMPAHANMHQNMWQHVQPFNDDIFLVKKESKKKKICLIISLFVAIRPLMLVRTLILKKWGKKYKKLIAVAQVWKF